MGHVPAAARTWRSPARLVVVGGVPALSGPSVEGVKGTLSNGPGRERRSASSGRLCK